MVYTLGGDEKAIFFANFDQCPVFHIMAKPSQEEQYHFWQNYHNASNPKLPIRTTIFTIAAHVTS